MRCYENNCRAATNCPMVLFGKKIFYRAGNTPVTLSPESVECSFLQMARYQLSISGMPLVRPVGDSDTTPCLTEL